jgi:hypothetical protein
MRRFHTSLLRKKVIGHFFALVLANRGGRFFHWNDKVAFGIVGRFLGAKEKVRAVRPRFLLDLTAFDFLESRFDIAQAIGRDDRLHGASRVNIVGRRIDAFLVLMERIVAQAFSLFAFLLVLLCGLWTLLNPMARRVTHTAHVAIRWSRLLVALALFTGSIVAGHVALGRFRFRHGCC